MSTKNTYITCQTCNKSFKSKNALNGHSKIHKPNYKKPNISNYSIEKRKTSIINYNLNPKLCKYCNNILTYDDKNKTFCNSSCSASYQNQVRKDSGWSLSIQSKSKISKSLTKTRLKTKSKLLPKTTKAHTKNTPKIINKLIIDSNTIYSKIFKTKCAHCGQLTIQRQQKKYCKNHAELYEQYNRNKYKFTFNVYDYPELFDINLINEIGWYSPGGKSGKWNINGLSRDHKISVNEAIKNNLDPYYITHVMNCEIMPHKENNSKKSTSSITYEELINMVDEFDLKFKTPHQGSAPRIAS